MPTTSTTLTPSTSPSSTWAQRWRRFLDEDAATLIGSSALLSGMYTIKEYRAPTTSEPTATAASPSLTSRRQRLQRALQRTLPLVPAIVASSAIGIIGMKLTLSAVQDARRDYSRQSVLIALPLFATLMHAPRGPRAMAKSAVGYGAFVYAADYATTAWHRRQFLKDEAATNEEELLRYHHHEELTGGAVFHPHPNAVFAEPGFFRETQ